MDDVNSHIYGCLIQHVLIYGSIAGWNYSWMELLMGGSIDA